MKPSHEMTGTRAIDIQVRCKVKYDQAGLAAWIANWFEFIMTLPYIAGAAK